MKKKYDFKAHEGEIEDLDFSPENKVKHLGVFNFSKEYYGLICINNCIFSKHLVTVGRDFSCSVWSGSQLAIGLNWLETRPEIPASTYRYMACR